MGTLPDQFDFVVSQQPRQAGLERIPGELLTTALVHPAAKRDERVRPDVVAFVFVLWTNFV